MEKKTRKSYKKPVKKPAPTNIIYPEVSDLEVAKKMLKIYQSAADRKLEFNLSFESVKKLLSYQTCYYTNKKFEDDGPFSRSFDRIDSSKGYIENNVVACTVDINGKKSNLSFDEIECLYKKLSSAKNKDPNEQVTFEPKSEEGSPEINEEVK